MFPDTIRTRATHGARPTPYLSSLAMPAPPPPRVHDPTMAGMGGSRDCRRACIRELDDLAQCLFIVQDLPAIDALSRIEPELPAELDFDAGVACGRMLRERAVLQAAASLEGQRPVAAWASVSPDLRDATARYARAVGAFAANLRVWRPQARPNQNPVFRFPEPAADPYFPPAPPGMRVIRYLLAHRKKYKNPAMLALRREHPGFRFDQRTFDLAWSIACSRPHQWALELLQLNTRQRVPLHAWGTLDELTDETAEAMRALRDWQYASYSDTAIPADDAGPPRPDSQHSKHPRLASMEDLCAISLCVYPVCPIVRTDIALDGDDTD